MRYRCNRPSATSLETLNFFWFSCQYLLEDMKKPAAASPRQLELTRHDGGRILGAPFRLPSFS